METLKIAFVTNNGSTISQHYGKSKYFEVVEIVDGLPETRERREKPRHIHGQSSAEKLSKQEENPEQEESHTKEMSDVIKDCDILVSKGIGEGALKKLNEHGIKVILTNETEIETALNLFLKGDLVNNPGKLHSSITQIKLPKKDKES